MKNKVEHIENQYTSQENKKNNVKNENACCSQAYYSICGRITCDNCCFINLACCPKHRNDIDAQERKAKEAQFQKQQNEEIALKEKLNNLNDKDYIEKLRVMIIT